MKIADGIEMLDISMKLVGGASTVHPTLIYDDDTVILVDAGAPGSAPQIKKEMEDADVAFERLDKIIITHQDIDHIGGIKSILEELADVEVLAHEEDKPYIQGEKKLVRMNAKFMERINALPEGQQEKVLHIFENTSANVDTTLADGDELDVSGGIITIHTPGHTPGHLCLYHKMSKTLVAGDSLNIADGQLVGPKKEMLNEEDAVQAMDSLRKFEDYDIENVVTYHGGLFSDNPNQRIKEIISRE